jgi:hypothetical protein
VNADIRGCALTVQIAGAVLASGNAVITYRSEWNGLDAVMPMDHWLECDGQRIDLSKLRSDWGEEDLARLEEKGALLRLRQWTNPDDEFERARWYLTNVVPRDPSGEAVALLQATRVLLSNPANALAGSRWESSSDYESEIARTIDALRSGSSIQLAAWADPDGDFVRVGTASGWEASARTIAEQMRLATTAIAAKMPPVPTLAPEGSASERVPGTVGEPLQGNAKQSAASVRRDMWIVNLFLADLVLHLVLFAALIGLPPNPINSMVQDWVLERSSPRGGFGTIDTEPIFWLSLVGVLVLFFGQLGVALLVQWGVRLLRGKDEIEVAPPSAPPSRDSVQTGLAPKERERGGASARANAASVATDAGGRPRGYYERRAALVVAIATPVVAGVLLLTDSVNSASAGSAATAARQSPGDRTARPRERRA